MISGQHVIEAMEPQRPSPEANEGVTHTEFAARDVGTGRLHSGRA